jgi:predicted O-methyltransferase YrrM
MQKLAIFKKYLNYRLFSSTSYDVHPPFLFDLVTRVFNIKSTDNSLHKIEALKQQLVRDNRIISVTDFGAGSISGSGKERKVSYIARTSSKSKKYGRLLARLVHYFQPETILELGTSLGLSSAYLAMGYPKAKVLTIEGCPNIANLAQSNFQKLEISNIILMNGSFDEKLPEVLKSLKKVDFVFIDGNHQKAPTIKYFELCLTKAVNETVLVFDDIHWSSGMEGAWDYIKNHPSVTLSVDIFFMGIVFLRKELTKQHFIIRF